MAVYNLRKYSNFNGINLQAVNGAIRFETPTVAPTTTSGERLLYVNSSNELLFNTGSSVITIVAGGAVVASTWDAIYQADQTLTMGLGALTFDRSAGNNAVLTLTNTGAGTGHVVQITNVGTGQDINGTSDSWRISATGVAILEELTIDGTEGSNIFTVTKGDVRFLDSALAVTDDDNAASFTVTNNTATTASVFVWAGSGAFTGSTTSSFFTLTPSGLTTGTAFYLPVAGLTTGKAIHVVANAMTDGLVVDLQTSATASTATGRLLNVAHTGVSSTSGIIAEFATAAQDETVLLRLTASDTLLLGTILQLRGSSVTTGFGLTASNLDALTSGIGVHLASAATAITGAGRLFYSNHTGATTTSGTLNEFATSATDETILLALTTAAMVNGQMLSIVGTTGMTTGSLIRATSSTAGAVATNGVYSFLGTGAFTSTASTLGLFHIAAASTLTGTITSILGGALTSGIALNITDSSAGMTSGSLLRVISGTTGAVATNGVVSLQASGDYTSTSNQGFVGVIANSTLAGTAASISVTAATTGVGLYIISSGTGITSGSLFRATTGTTGAVATNGVVSVRATGAYTSTSNAGLLDVQASAITGTATLVNFMTTAAAQTGTRVLNVENSGFTTGYTGTMARFATPSTTGACRVVGIVADSMTTAGVGLHVSAAALEAGGMGISVDITAATAGNLLNLITTGAYTGTGMALITAGAMVTGIGLSIISTTGLTTGSLIRATSSTAGAIATNGAISFVGTGVFTSTSRVGFLEVRANSTTGGTIAHVVGTGITDGTVLSLEAVEATLTTGLYIQCYDGAANDFSVGRYGATIIAGNATGTAALTLTNGNVLLTSGNQVFTAGTTIFTPQAIVNANTAISVTHGVTTIANNAGSTHTLADGVAGQTKTIVCTVYTADAVITPANLANGTTLTLNAVGDACDLIFLGTEWWTTNLYGTAALA